LSQGTFRSFFVEIGLPPGAAVPGGRRRIDWRAVRAWTSFEQLLAETDLPLIEVAERSGFKYQEYLGATFKAHIGQTPAQYRREASLNHS